MDGYFSCSLSFVLELDIFMPFSSEFCSKTLNAFFFRRLQGPRLVGSWDVCRSKSVMAVRWTTLLGDARAGGGRWMRLITCTHGNRGASTKQGIRVEAGGLLEDQGVIKRVNGVSWEDPVSQD